MTNIKCWISENFLKLNQWHKHPDSLPQDGNIKKYVNVITNGQHLELTPVKILSDFILYKLTTCRCTTHKVQNLQT